MTCPDMANLHQHHPWSNEKMLFYKSPRHRQRLHNSSMFCFWNCQIRSYQILCLANSLIYEPERARLTQLWNLMRFRTKIFSQFKYDVNLYFKKDKFWNSSAFSNPAFSIRSQTETWPLWKHILTSLLKYWISEQTSFHMQWRNIILILYY